jgi:hypothetical protein
MVVAPKTAVPVGTVAGVQLLAVLKSELPGAVDQVASWARAGMAASNATAAVVANKCARIPLAPLRRCLDADWHTFAYAGSKATAFRAAQRRLFCTVVSPQPFARIFLWDISRGHGSSHPLRLPKKFLRSVGSRSAAANKRRLQTVYRVRAENGPTSVSNLPIGRIDIHILDGSLADEHLSG